MVTDEGGRAPSSEGSPDGERLQPGTMVGEYRVEALLGEGGFGAVYRASHPIIGKSVAIKILHKIFSGDSEVVSRFIAEARAVNQIRHKNIIDIFAFGAMPDGRHYYVMEQLEGGTLEQHVDGRGGRLPVTEALTILRPLARALHAAHGRGIAHRDIKPENVFLTVDDEGEPVPKLLDFGIAKLLGDGPSQHKTQPGMPMGTPAYMAPEQVHGKATDHRTDIYAFGVMVYEILTGQPPFEATSAVGVMMKQVSAPIPRMSDAAPDLSPMLDEPVMKMMAKEPADRPASLVEAVDALVAAAERAGAVRADKFTRLAINAEDSHSSTSPTIAGVTAIDRDGKTLSGAQTDASQPSGRMWILVVASVAFAGLLIALLASGAFRTETPAARGTEAPSSAATEAEKDPSASPPATTGPSVAPIETSAPPASAVSPSKTVKVKIVAKPSDADIVLGKKKLGKAGDDIEIERGTAKVKLVVARAGYIPRVIEIVPDKDIEENVTLVPAPREYTW